MAVKTKVVTQRETTLKLSLERAKTFQSACIETDEKNKQKSAAGQTPRK